MLVRQHNAGRRVFSFFSIEVIGPEELNNDPADVRTSQDISGVEVILLCLCVSTTLGTLQRTHVYTVQHP